MPEMSIEYSAYESGLHRFVSKKKNGDYIGKAGLEEWQARGVDNAFVTLKVHDTTDADAIGGNPIYLDGKLVGRCTSGGYGFRLGYSIALAMVSPDLAEVGTIFDIDILGTSYKAEIVQESPFDVDNNHTRLNTIKVRKSYERKYARRRSRRGGERDARRQVETVAA